MEVLLFISICLQWVLIPYISASRGNNPVLNQFLILSADFGYVLVSCQIKQTGNPHEKYFLKYFLLILYIIFSLSNSLSDKYWSFPTLRPFFSYEVQVSTPIYTVHWFLLLVKNITDDFISVIGTVVAKKDFLACFPWRSCFFCSNVNILQHHTLSVATVRF